MLSGLAGVLFGDFVNYGVNFLLKSGVYFVTIYGVGSWLAL